MRIVMPTPELLLKAATEPVPVGTPIYREAQMVHELFLECGYVHPISPAVFEAGIHVGLRLAQMTRDAGNLADSISRGYKPR